jgi:teichuronic acid biosynthesis glycosyltransferase TuaG
MPYLSIIMPYYKKEKFIHQSIMSILKQSFNNFEILIIDDENTSASKEILNKISKVDNRIRVVRNRKNLGVGISRNKGINISKGKYLAFCDCDDLWHHNKIRNQLNFMRKNDIKFSYTSYYIIDEKNNIISFRDAPNKIELNKLLKSCDIGLSTVIIEKKILLKKKYFFTSIQTKEDYVLWLKLAKDQIKMCGLNKKLAYWRKSKNSLSSSLWQKIFDGYKVYNYYQNFSPIKSLYYLFFLSINYLIKK